MNWFDDLQNQALVHFPNMPTPYIENAILTAARKFFRQTHLLKDDAYIDADCGGNEYVIDIPEGRTVVQVKAVYGHTNPDAHPLLDASWSCIPPADTRFGSGYWVDLSHSVPTLSVADCYVQRTGQYCVTYSWTPTARDCAMPHHFVGKYFDALLHGVLAELYLIPMDNDTQSAPMARFHMQEFNRHMMNAGAEETQNHTNRPLHMTGGMAYW